MKGEDQEKMQQPPVVIMLVARLQNNSKPLEKVCPIYYSYSNLYVRQVSLQPLRCFFLKQVVSPRRLYGEPIETIIRA